MKALVQIAGGLLFSLSICGCHHSLTLSASPASVNGGDSVTLTVTCKVGAQPTTKSVSITRIAGPGGGVATPNPVAMASQVSRSSSYKTPSVTTTKTITLRASTAGFPNGDATLTVHPPRVTEEVHGSSDWDFAVAPTEVAKQSDGKWKFVYLVEPVLRDPTNPSPGTPPEITRVRITLDSSFMTPDNGPSVTATAGLKGPPPVSHTVVEVQRLPHQRTFEMTGSDWVELVLVDDVDLQPGSTADFIITDHNGVETAVSGVVGPKR